MSKHIGLAILAILLTVVSTACFLLPGGNPDAPTTPVVGSPTPPAGITPPAGQTPVAGTPARTAVANPTSAPAPTSTAATAVPAATQPPAVQTVLVTQVAVQTVVVVQTAAPAATYTPYPTYTAYPTLAAAPAASQTPGPQTTPAAGMGSSWTPAQKCAWLSANFPQTTQGVQQLGAQLAKVQPQRIRAGRYPCGAAGNGVFDGFVVLGPNEGFGGEVTMTVAIGGAIDSYAESCGAQYSTKPRLVAGGAPNVCDNTWQTDVGTVTALSMTYWPWNDAAPPIGGGQVGLLGTPVAATTPAAAGPCQQPQDLAKAMGWSEKGWGDQKFGGLRVELAAAGTLPALWEGIASGRKIAAADPAREMVPTVWTIYPPFECREKLGYSK